MYLKSQQTKTNKEKKDKVPFGQRKSNGDFGKKKTRINKKSKKSLASNEDREYLQASKEQELSCWVCGCFAHDRHHVKEFSSDKKNHKQVLPLCKEHHIGKELSPHGTPRKWREKFPIEFQRQEADRYYADTEGKHYES